MMRKILTVAATATLSLVAFSTTVPETALAKGGALAGGNRPGGAPAGGAAAGGANRGGAARPSGPTIPGRGGATGGTLLEKRRARTKRLREASSGGPSASSLPPTTPGPSPAGRRGGGVPTPARTPDTSLVHVHHGKVRMFAGLARVDLTLEVQNVGAAVMEWRRTYAIDPACEVIGAVLMRTNRAPIKARTLTTWDAFQCYARIRTPPTSRRPERRPRDPLLVSRPRRDRLEVQIWPIIADETIRVRITFVTPLRGVGAKRTYRDVMGGSTKEEPRTPRLSRPGTPRERPPEPTPMVNHDADWVMQPGHLVLSSAPATGMTFRGEVGGKLQFAGHAAVRPDQPAPTVTFLSPRRETTALMVDSSRLSGRIAAFRFNPHEYLTRKGFVLTRGMQIRLKSLRGSTRRIVPNRFAPDDEPRPVTAQVIQPTARNLKYRVQVLDRHGNEVVEFTESLPLERPKVDADLQASLTGWHRAQLAQRVFQWAGTNWGRREEAVRYAVDLGVLIRGSAAIAIPANERQRLTPELRRLYAGDGVQLGAARRQADVKQPPRGSLKDK